MMESVGGIAASESRAFTPPTGAGTEYESAVCCLTAWRRVDETASTQYPRQPNWITSFCVTDVSVSVTLVVDFIPVCVTVVGFVMSRPQQA